MCSSSSWAVLLLCWGRINARHKQFDLDVFKTVPKLSNGVIFNEIQWQDLSVIAELLVVPLLVVYRVRDVYCQRCQGVCKYYDDDMDDDDNR